MARFYIYAHTYIYVYTPYNNIPFHGFLDPTNICGNLIGRITASYNDFFAFSSPAISDHLTLGFSVTMASINPVFNLSPSSVSFFAIFLFSFVSSYGTSFYS